MPLHAADIPRIAVARRLSEASVYGCSADCHADLPHRLAHGIKKGVAGVLHQMPTVGNLTRVRQGLCRCLRIPAAAVSCDDLDLGLLDQPGSGGRGLSVGEQSNRLSTLKIANDRPISMISTPRPVIKEVARFV